MLNSINQSSLAARAGSAIEELYGLLKTVRVLSGMGKSTLSKQNPKCNPDSISSSSFHKRGLIGIRSIRLWRYPGERYGKHMSKEEAENDSANAVTVPPPRSSHANVGLPTAVHGIKTRYGGH
ncbi:phosphoglucan, water dikinase [Actinidia rufa]|uniref:Phosphoglucan, water dikinase n=1 Tax=Actinidia rufa TaxID=165716 RepID=A0A7J0GDV8_9ERIC|nr:phosphoglucan, water dikinase [Actinidia rufa]